MGRANMPPEERAQLVQRCRDALGLGLALCARDGDAVAAAAWRDAYRTAARFIDPDLCARPPAGDARAACWVLEAMHRGQWSPPQAAPGASHDLAGRTRPLPFAEGAR